MLRDRSNLHQAVCYEKLVTIPCLCATSQEKSSARIPQLQYKSWDHTDASKTNESSEKEQHEELKLARTFFFFLYMKTFSALMLAS